MTSFDDFQRFLPQYLSPEPKERLFRDLKKYPLNLPKRMYSASNMFAHDLLQGDGVEGLLIVSLPDTTSKKGMAIIVSNTCDISKGNKRDYMWPRLVYCPILRMSAYEQLISSATTTEQQKQAHLKDVRDQAVTNFFFLPKGGNLQADGLVPFDMMINTDNTKVDHARLCEKKLFTLSNYGWYCFLFKLGLHFSRMNEGVDREEYPTEH